MKKTIGITGSHGTGKTDYTLALTNRLKRLYPGKSILCMTENCAFAPEDIQGVNTNTTLAAQYWIFANQIAREREAVAKFDIVVTDRTVMDAVAYTAVAGHSDVAQAMHSLAVPYIHDFYSAIYFRRIEDHDFLVNDGLRSMDLKFRRDVESYLLECYKTGDIDVSFDDFDPASLSEETEDVSCFYALR